MLGLVFSGHFKGTYEWDILLISRMPSNVEMSNLESEPLLHYPPHQN